MRALVLCRATTPTPIDDPLPIEAGAPAALRRSELSGTAVLAS
jgi:hypothetical protein